MPSEVNITARAESDNDDVLAWMQTSAPLTMNRWYTRLMAAVRTLEVMPERCPLADEANELGIEMRELLFGKRRGVFRVLFTIDGQTVNVIHVRRAARGPITPDEA